MKTTDENYATLPEYELATDLHNGLLDIDVCQMALDAGRITYGQDNASIADRQATNIKINDVIRKELMRRWSEK